MDAGREPAAEGELANINGNDVQHRPLVSHEGELGDLSWRALMM